MFANTKHRQACRKERLMSKGKKNVKAAVKAKPTPEEAIVIAYGKVEKTNANLTIARKALASAAEDLRTKREDLALAMSAVKLHSESMGDKPSNSDKAKKVWLESVEHDAQDAVDSAKEMVEKSQKIFETKTKAVTNATAALSRAEDALDIANQKAITEATLTDPKETTEVEVAPKQPEDIEGVSENPVNQPEKTDEVAPKEPADKPENKYVVTPKSSANSLMRILVIGLGVLLLALLALDGRATDDQQNEMLISLDASVTSLQTDLAANTAADKLSDTEREHQRYILQLSVNRSNLKEIEEMGYGHKEAWKLMNKVAINPNIKTWEGIIAGAPKYIGKRVDTNEAAIKVNAMNIDSLIQQIVLKKQAAVEHAHQGMEMFTTPDTTKKGK